MTTDTKAMLWAARYARAAPCHFRVHKSFESCTLAANVAQGLLF
ncbi:hypothetical protein SAMN05660666_02607 [Novosphingobium aromaticivorans]|nr:hypothetical protein [Novosphingobium aromaticivorans]SCY70993.1 hypothetical protein SAMN05660666_02607 [Novosphingobium aromaticivorans]